MYLRYLLFLFLSQLNLTKTKFVSADAVVGHSHPFPRHHLGAQLCVNTRTDTIGLVLATHTYCLQFMVLPMQGLDAILGLNWLRVYGVVLDLKQRVVELRLPSSKDRMSLLMPLDTVLPVVAHVEASPDLASIPMV